MVGYYILMVGYYILMVGYYILMVGYYILMVGYYILMVGYYILMVGYYILMVGYYILRVISRGFSCSAEAIMGPKAYIHAACLARLVQAEATMSRTSRSKVVERQA